MGFQGEIRPRRLICYSNTLWPQNRLDNRSQWPENGTLDFNTLQDLHNFCCHNSKWLEIPMFRLSSLSALDPLSVNPVLLLKYSYPTLGHIFLIQCLPIPVQTFLLLPSTLPTTAHPLSLPIPLQPLQIQFHNLHLTSPPPSLFLKPQLRTSLPSLGLRRPQPHPLP